MRFVFFHARIDEFSRREANIRRLKRLKHFNDCGRARCHFANSGETLQNDVFLKRLRLF